MNTRTFSKLAGLALVVAMAVPSPARADLSINMGTVLSGSFTSGDMSSSPYLNATIVNGANNGVSGVYLTMSAPGLGFAGSGNYEHVNNGGMMANPAWLFNLTSTAGLTTSDFTVISKTGNSGFTTPTITIDATSVLQAGMMTSEYYNLGFAFAEGNNMATPSTDGRNGGVEFGFGDTIQYFITGLTTASFHQAVTTSGGSTLDTNYSAAAIDDSGPNLWVAGTATSLFVQSAPEPASWVTVVLALPGFVGFVLVNRKRGRASAS